MIDALGRVDTWPCGLVSGTISGLTRKQPWPSVVKFSDTDVCWLRVAGIDVANGPGEQDAEACYGQRNSSRQHDCYSLSGNPRKLEAVFRILGSDVPRNDSEYFACSIIRDALWRHTRHSDKTRSKVNDNNSRLRMQVCLRSEDAGCSIESRMTSSSREMHADI